MGTGDDLDRRDLGGVPGDGPQLVAVGADHVGRHVRVPGVALGPGDPQPVTEPGGLRRVDGQHRVPRGDQGAPARAAVGLDPHQDLGLVGVLPGRLTHDRVQPGHARHALGQPGPGQPSAGAGHHLDVVMVLGPVISHEQSQRSSALDADHLQRPAGEPSAT